MFLREYLRTYNLDKAYSGSFGSFSNAPVSNIILFLLIFYVLYGIRFMRLKVVATEPELFAISPQGEETLHRIFSRVSDSRPPIILTVIFSAQGLPNIDSPGDIPPLLWFGGLVVTGLFTFVWVYFSSLWGLYKLGKQPLKLKPYYEDTTLGVRPVGSLSLSLAFAYFIGIGLFALSGAVTGTPPPPNVIAFFSATVLLGVIMFFLPLNSIHRRMAQEKRREHGLVRNKLVEVLGRQPSLARTRHK